MEVGLTWGKALVVGVVCAEQESDTKVSRPRSNQVNGLLNRPVLCHTRPGLNLDRKPGS